MPGGDKTGPMGMGPMTGRGAGYCMDFAAPGFIYPRAAYRMGRGYGRGGRGFRRMYGFMPIQNALEEKELLANQTEYLEDQLRIVKKRLRDLDGQDE